MKRARGWALLLLASPWLLAAEPPKKPRAPTKILLLGTFHFDDAGLDEYKPSPMDMSRPERQRQMDEVVGCLEKFAPTRVAVEAPSVEKEELSKRYASYRAGQAALAANEVDQLGFRLAGRLGLSRVDAIDAPAHWFDPFVDPTEYAVAHGQSAALAITEKPWDDYYQGLNRYEEILQNEQTLREHLRLLNSEEALRLSAGQYLFGTFKVGDGKEYPGADAKTGWYNRNLRIFSNITRLGTTAADRIVVVIGAGHVPILRHLVSSSPEYELVAAEDVLGPACNADTTLAEAVRKSSYALEWRDGKLAGPGADWLARAAEGSQFVALAEPHNVKEVPGFAADLLRFLGARQGYGFLALEQGTAAMTAMTTLTEDAVPREALHFDTDEEVALIHAVASIPGSPGARVWGLDREIHPQPLLMLLANTADGPCREAAQAAQRSWTNGAREPSDWFRAESARALLQRCPDDSLGAASLRAAIDYYRAYAAAERGEPTGYDSNAIREDWMKEAFRRQYASAQQERERLPRVLVKAGHWHVGRGLNPGDVLSLGSFLTDLAAVEGKTALLINLQPLNPPGQLWSLSDYPAYAPLAAAGDPQHWVLVDLRPLRGMVHAGVFQVSSEVRENGVRLRRLAAHGQRAPGNRATARRAIPDLTLLPRVTRRSPDPK